MRSISKIIIHCSDTPAGRHVTVADINRWHMERGFRCIGYHYVIYLDGSVHQGRALGCIGAHCLGQNANSIGICYVGGRDASGHCADTRTPAQRLALLALVRRLRQQFPSVSAHGHNEFAAKECPCFDVQQDKELCAIR